MSKKKHIEGADEIATRVAKTAARQEVRAVFHRGPLPSPEQMAKYEELWPGATKYFFTALTKQTEHRQSIEKQVISSNISATKRGQWMAFILFGIILVGGFVLMYIGKNVTGLITAMSGVAGPLALFFGRRKSSDQSLYSKDPSSKHK